MTVISNLCFEKTIHRDCLDGEYVEDHDLQLSLASSSDSPDTSEKRQYDCVLLDHLLNPTLSLTFGFLMI